MTASLSVATATTPERRPTLATFPVCERWKLRFELFHVLFEALEPCQRTCKGPACAPRHSVGPPSSCCCRIATRFVTDVVNTTKPTSDASNVHHCLLRKTQEHRRMQQSDCTSSEPSNVDSPSCQQWIRLDVYKKQSGRASALLLPLLPSQRRIWPPFSAYLLYYQLKIPRLSQIKTLVMGKKVFHPSRCDSKARLDPVEGSWFLRCACKRIAGRTGIRDECVGTGLA